MNLIEQLEEVMDLVARGAPYSAIWSRLLALEEGVYGAARAAANGVELAQEHAALIRVNAKLFAKISELLEEGQPPIPKASDEWTHHSHTMGPRPEPVVQKAAPFSLSPSGMFMESRHPAARHVQDAAGLVRRA